MPRTTRGYFRLGCWSKDACSRNSRLVVDEKDRTAATEGSKIDVAVGKRAQWDYKQAGLMVHPPIRRSIHAHMHVDEKSSSIHAHMHVDKKSRTARPQTEELGEKACMLGYKDTHSSVSAVNAENDSGIFPVRPLELRYL